MRPAGVRDGSIFSSYLAADDSGERYSLPVAKRERVYGTITDQLGGSALPNTLDVLSPAHDHPETAASLGTRLEEGSRIVRVADFVRQGCRFA